MNDFERCIKERNLLTIKATKEMIDKEITSADYDLSRSKKSMQDEDYKWASVQAYYSMFHAAKALVFKKGYREKSHYCFIIAIRELYVKDGTMNDELADTLELCMHLRHDADYGLIYDTESAETAIRYAQQFLSVSNKLLKS
ncbi:MAG: HEPN domain-containing protein [Thermoplasmata archaeon]|nr:HEPN domain-containing protein [Thermoplasmata archaeon]